MPARAPSASPIRSTRTRSPSNRPATSATTGSRRRSSRRSARSTPPRAPRRSTASSAPSARAPTARRRPWSATTRPRSTSKTPTSAGAPAPASTARRECRSTSRSAAPSTSSATACCCATARADGGSRGGYWTGARKAFEFAAIGRFKPGNHTFEAFYLDKDDMPEADSDSKLWGVNYEYAIGEDTTLGATYMKWSADADEAPQRDGLDVYNLRAYTAPFSGLKATVLRGGVRHRRQRRCARFHRVERAGRLPVRLDLAAEAFLSLCHLRRRRSRDGGERGLRRAADRIP